MKFDDRAGLGYPGMVIHAAAREAAEKYPSAVGHLRELARTVEVDLLWTK